MTQGDFGIVAGVRPGDLLAGKYRVERVLGRGGMGVVVSAHHVQLEERVALKFLLPEALTDPETVARFAREARAAVKIKSEHVAAIKDVGTLDNGAPYMVMEYLEGGDLAEWIRQQGAMPVAQAVEFVLQACVAVAEAHALGIVHRDLKPANLFCVRRSDGHLSIKVLDFGISKRVDMTGSAPALDMTKTSALMGSPLYMSPEQLRSAKQVDARTDIWALGAVLFELVTARPPFLADTLPQLILKTAGDPPAPMAPLRNDLPAGFEAAILKCLEKDPERRYENVGQLALALLPFAPSRARASVERISDIVNTGGLSAHTVRMPPSRRGAAVPSASTLPAVSRTAAGTTPRTPVLVGVLLAVVAVGSTGAFFVATRVMPHREPGARATADPPPAASSALPALLADAPAHTGPPAVSVPGESHDATTAPTPPVDGAAAAAEVPAPAVPRTRRTPRAPSGEREAGAAQAPHPAPATTPTCTIATDYDDQGQPHFRKVCK